MYIASSGWPRRAKTRSILLDLLVYDKMAVKKVAARLHEQEQATEPID